MNNHAHLLMAHGKSAQGVKPHMIRTCIKKNLLSIYFTFPSCEHILKRISAKKEGVYIC